MDFSVVTHLDGLVKHLVNENNLYVGMRVFLGINYIMFLNKLPTTKVIGNVKSSLITRALEILWLDQVL